MPTEREYITSLFARLDEQPRYYFPERRQALSASNLHGVYVIRSPRGRVLHVGRTVRGQDGLRQRLRNHLNSQSSFVEAFLYGNGSELRNGYTFQYLVVKSDRKRALLEHFATAHFCPRHLGLGRKEKGQ